MQSAALIPQARDPPWFWNTELQGLKAPRKISVGPQYGHISSKKVEIKKKRMLTNQLCQVAKEMHLVPLIILF